jgi:hypothetical protein
VTPPRPVLDDRAVDRLLAGRSGGDDADLQQAVTLVRSLGSGPAPVPTAALAGLLDSGFEPVVVPLRRSGRGRTWTAAAAGALTAAAAALVVAGTADALPAPLQDGVADLVSAVTPFELPRPGAPDPAPPPTGREAPVGAPAPSVPVTTAPSAARPTEDGAGAERERQDAPDDGGSDDRSTAERQERDRQRAAEEAADESQRAAEDAAEQAERQRRDAAREREDAAREAARASEEAAEEAAEQAERDAEDAAEDDDG